MSVVVPLSGSITQLEFDDVPSIATNGGIPLSEGLQAASGKGRFQPDNRNGCGKYNYSHGNQWFLGFDDKGNDMHMKHCKRCVHESVAESQDKKKATKTDNKVVHVDREEKSDPEVEMIVRKK